MQIPPSENDADSEGQVALEEAALLVNLDRSDPETLAALYDRFAKVVYSLASRMLSDPQELEEVTQDVFLSIWKNSEKYDPDRSSPLTWIASITRNKCIDRLRKAGRRIPRAYGEDDNQIPVIDDRAGSNPFLMASMTDLSEQVQICLDHLSETQRETVDSAYFDCLTTGQIAEKFSVPLGTVKSRLRLAMDKLRRCLRQERRAS